MACVSNSYQESLKRHYLAPWVRFPVHVSMNGQEVTLSPSKSDSRCSKARAAALRSITVLKKNGLMCQLHSHKERKRE